MDLNQLKTFVTVAEEKHLTRAAERLFTSQPAVSAQLKALEEQLKVRLFDRTPKGMILTPAGTHLLKSAQDALAAANNVLSEAKHLQDKLIGKLEIGINSDFAFLRIPQLLTKFREKHPSLQLSFVNSMSYFIVPDVRKNVLDSGFFFGPCNPLDLSITTLADIPTAVVIPKDWSEELLNADIETLAQQKWIYTNQKCPFYAVKEELFAESKYKPNQDLFVDTEEGIRELIKANSGISLLRLDDAMNAEREGWGVAWKGQTPSITLNVAINASRVNDPLLLAWLEEIKACWQLPQNKEEAQQAS